MFVGLAAWNGMDKRVLVLEEDRRARAEATFAKELLLKEDAGGTD